MEKPLAGQVVLVTGGGRGIGRECALTAAEAGAAVAVAATTESQICAVADELREMGADALAVRTDVTRVEETDRMVRETVSTLGSLDVLISAAGFGGRRCSLLDLDAEMMRELITVNVLGVLYTCQSALRQMVQQKRGHIINISSGLSQKGVPNAICYGSSKWAVEGITQGIAAEFKDRGIRAHSLSPGRVITQNFPLSELTKDRYGEVRPVEAIRGSLMSLLTDPDGYPNGRFLSAVEWDRERGIAWKSPLLDE
jgi:NAD(P)-dependent dehydrogenase (short-subunit alcohol dehydrogenase family)